MAVKRTARKFTKSKSNTAKTQDSPKKTVKKLLIVEEETTDESETKPAKKTSKIDISSVVKEIQDAAAKEEEAEKESENLEKEGESEGLETIKDETMTTRPQAASEEAQGEPEEGLKEEERASEESGSKLEEKQEDEIEDLPEPKPKKDTDSFWESPGEEKPSNNKPLFILIFLIIVLLGLVTFVYFWSKNRVPKPVTPAATPTPSAAPTEASIDLSKYDIEVLNGSGVAGAAADVKTQLSDAGYTVTSTGNASSSSHETTEISSKSSVDSDYLKKLTTELSGKYSVTKGDALDDNSKFDVVVTLGSKAAGQ